MFAKNWKVALLAVLIMVGGWLARRNLFPAASPAAAGVLVKPGEQRAGQPSGGKNRRGGELLVDVDPTLRLDLLEAARAVKYQGASRNIFEIYTPPPPPKPPPPPPINAGGDAPPVPPKPPEIPLKYYGLAQASGSNVRHAYLTDGDDIVIAREGDLVAKFYKINRIGLTSMEIEDTRTKKSQQLPLIEE